MLFRKLGRTNIDVSEIGYGAWGIGQKQWLGATDHESMMALRRAIELGLNFIDTALAYGEGHSEELVGRVLATQSHKIYVASKVPPKNMIWPAKLGTALSDVFPRDYVIEATETSLRNLNQPYLDLQQFHVWNPEWTAQDEWRRTVEDLKTSGKVHYVGISINAHQPNTALDIIETGLIDTVQVIYNVFDQTPRQNLFAAAMKHNVGVIARVPFDEGSLTGLVNRHTVFPEGDFRAGYFKGDRKIEVEERVAAILADLDLPLSDLPQIAIRFCLSHPAVSTVIPGMRSLRSVEANCSYSRLGGLPANALAVLEQHAWDRNFYE